MLMKRICSIGVLIALGGCMQQPNGMSDYDRCEGYGFAAGSDPFAQCLMQQDQQRRALVGQMLLRPRF